MYSDHFRLIDDVQVKGAPDMMYSEIRFPCSGCGEIVAEQIVIPDVTEVGDSEDYFEIVTCKTCRMRHEMTYKLEYGQLTASITSVRPKSIWISTPEIEEKVFVPEDIAWYSEVTQQSIYKYFVTSINDVRNMYSTEFDDVGKEAIFNRMLYVQVITALEAYLADTLISHVIYDKEHLLRLIQKDKGLCRERYSLEAFMENPDLPEYRAKKYLSDILYHNLPKVEYLYKEILNIQLVYVDGSGRQFLLEAIAIRHDLVHRNGRKKGEEGYYFIRRPDVEYLADTVERLVHETQGQIDILLEIPF